MAKIKIGPWVTSLVGALAVIGAIAFINDPSLSLMLMHPLVLLACWAALYGGGLVLLIGLIWLFSGRPKTAG